MAVVFNKVSYMLKSWWHVLCGCVSFDHGLDWLQLLTAAGAYRFSIVQALWLAGD